MARNWADTVVALLVALAALMILGQMAMDAYRVSGIQADPEIVERTVINKEKSRVLVEKYRRDEVRSRKQRVNPRFAPRP